MSFWFYYSTLEVKLLLLNHSTWQSQIYTHVFGLQFQGSFNHRTGTVLERLWVNNTTEKLTNKIWKPVKYWVQNCYLPHHFVSYTRASYSVVLLLYKPI